MLAYLVICPGELKHLLRWILIKSISEKLNEIFCVFRFQNIGENVQCFQITCSSAPAEQEEPWRIHWTLCASPWCISTSRAPTLPWLISSRPSIIPRRPAGHWRRQFLSGTRSSLLELWFINTWKMLPLAWRLNSGTVILVSWKVFPSSWHSW